jgi:OmpA-OmpF porin, OOP family
MTGNGFPTTSTRLSRSLLVVWVVVVAVALTGCTGGSGGEPGGATEGSSQSPGTGSQSPAPTPSGPPPYWTGPASWFNPQDKPQQAELSVYPLQRIDGGLLLTVDLRPAADLSALNYFCIGSSCDDMSGVSLVDTLARVRYGPLKQGDEVLSSRIRYGDQRSGVTYRFGAFFPDPGTASTMSVDLQYGGLVPGVPVTDGEPFPGLVSDTGSDDAAGSRAFDAKVGDTVLWPVRRPGAGATVDRHDLVAKVVGGTVNEGRGVVSLNADILFAFNSATLSPEAASLLESAAKLLLDKADPGKPVKVVGYTDDVGTESFNDELSRKRAAAVAAVLKGKVGGLGLTVTGRGEKDPVAANHQPGGGDNPSGRALNRRVEISYPPKPAAAPTSSATATAGTGTAGGQGPSVDLPARSVEASQTPPVNIATRVWPVQRDGTLTLVTADLTAELTRILIDPFTAQGDGSQDVSALHLVDPATKKVYIPAYDQDDPTRVLGSYTIGYTAGTPTHLFFYVADLPSSLSSVTVDLGQLGQATGVLVR